jgi:hypothetical protein
MIQSNKIAFSSTVYHFSKLLCMNICRLFLKVNGRDVKLFYNINITILNTAPHTDYIVIEHSLRPLPYKSWWNGIFIYRKKINYIDFSNTSDFALCLALVKRNKKYSLFFAPHSRVVLYDNNITQGQPLNILRYILFISICLSFFYWYLQMYIFIVLHLP